MLCAGAVYGATAAFLCFAVFLVFLCFLVADLFVDLCFLAPCLGFAAGAVVAASGAGAAGVVATAGAACVIGMGLAATAGATGAAVCAKAQTAALVTIKAVRSFFMMGRGFDVRVVRSSYAGVVQPESYPRSGPFPDKSTLGCCAGATFHQGYAAAQLFKCHGVACLLCALGLHPQPSQQGPAPALL